jgi:hypothetical protein
MMQNELITREMAAIGEEIGYELGAQLVKAFQVANPTDIQWYAVGRNIIDQILAQPGCVGIKFYNAYNEMGEKTLVYVGVDANGQTILNYSSVNQTGILETQKGIVADRLSRGGRSSDDADNWTWDVD